MTRSAPMLAAHPVLATDSLLDEEPGLQNRCLYRIVTGRPSGS